MLKVFSWFNWTTFLCSCVVNVAYVYWDLKTKATLLFFKWLSLTEWNLSPSLCHDCGAFLAVLSDIVCSARRSLALSCFQGTVKYAGSQHTSVPACLSHMQEKKRSIKSNLTNGVHSCWDCIFQHLKAWVLHPDEKQLHLHVLYRPKWDVWIIIENK